MKKKLLVLFLLPIFLLNCSKTEFQNQTISNEELQDVILGDANFQQALNAANLISTSIKERTMSMSSDEKLKLKSLMAENPANYSSLTNEFVDSRVDHDLINNLEVIYRLTLIEKINSTVTIPLKKLYVSLNKMNINPNQIREALISLANDKKQNNSARVNGYIDCVNQAYYCQSVALNECFLSSSPNEVNSCVFSAEFTLLINLINCEVSYPNN